MAEARKSQSRSPDAERERHTAESFGRRNRRSLAAAAADKAAKVETKGPIKMELNVTVTQISGGLERSCVWDPRLRNLLQLERQD